MKNKLIEFNSHLGLCGVAYMDICNGLHRKDLYALSKGIMNQIDVMLIAKGYHKNSYKDRVKLFLELYPEYFYLKYQLNKMIFIKHNISTYTYNNVYDFYRPFAPLFSIENLNNIFGFKGNLTVLYDKLDKNDQEKLIRIMYMAYYFVDVELLNRIDKENIISGNIFLNKITKNTLYKINKCWSQWLYSMSIIH